MFKLSSSQTIVRKEPSDIRRASSRGAKGSWTTEEDQALLAWVQRFGAQRWTDCSKVVQGRCGKQCRERWVNILNPQVKKGDWSELEQLTIFSSLVQYSTAWSTIARSLPGRTENSIKNYFYSSLRRIKAGPLGSMHKSLTTLDSQEVREQLARLNLLGQRLYLLATTIEDIPIRQVVIDFLEFDSKSETGKTAASEGSLVSICEQEKISEQPMQPRCWNCLLRTCLRHEQNEISSKILSL